MVKICDKAGSCVRTALVVLGWIAFVLGVVVDNLKLAVPLQVIARVLPESP